jgi:hypothetical protein
MPLSITITACQQKIPCSFVNADTGPRRDVSGCLNTDYGPGEGRLWMTQPGPDTIALPETKVTLSFRTHQVWDVPIRKFATIHSAGAPQQLLDNWTKTLPRTSSG